MNVYALENVTFIALDNISVVLNREHNYFYLIFSQSKSGDQTESRSVLFILNRSAFHALRKHCELLVTAESRSLSARRGSSSDELQAKSNRIMFEHLFPLGWG